MHELSLAGAILPVVLEVAAERGPARVTALTVQAGALQQIVPESLATAFAALAVGTAAEGAALSVETVGVAARCRRCGAEFEVECFVFQCPACHLADVETVRGNELILSSVELEPCESTSSTTC